MAGNRLYFPVQAVMFYRGREWDTLEKTAKTNGYDNADSATPYTAHGVQDVAMTSNFPLTPVFELGQSNTYENTEGIPTVEITLSKVLDGKPLLWHLATLDAVAPTLSARTAAYSTFQLGLWPDTEERCFWGPGGGGINGEEGIDSGPNGETMPIGVIACSKCYPSSLGYTVTVGENSKEDLTLSGNEKVWARALQSKKKLPGGRDAFTIQEDARFNTAYADFKDNNDTPDQRISQGYNVMLKPITLASEAAGFAADPDTWSKKIVGVTDKNGALMDADCSVFPSEIPGITLWGTNDVEAMLHEVESVYQPDPNFARLQSVSFKVDITREDVPALGYKLPTYKSAKMPIQIATEITVVSTTDDGIQVSAFTSACQNTAALQAGTIRLAICNGDYDDVDRESANGVRIYAGDQNKPTSVSYGQGGTGGGNVQATYSYQSHNKFTVVAKSDPNMNQKLKGTNTVVEPVFDTDPDSPTYGEILTGGAWWQEREKWVC